MEKAGFKLCMPTNWGAMSVSLPRACIGIGVWYIVFGFLWILNSFERWFPWFELITYSGTSHITTCIFSSLFIGIAYIVIAIFLILSTVKGNKCGKQVFVWGLIVLYVLILLHYFFLISDTYNNSPTVSPIGEMKPDNNIGRQFDPSFDPNDPNYDTKKKQWEDAMRKRNEAISTEASAGCFSGKERLLLGAWSAVWQWWPWWIVFTYMSSKVAEVEDDQPPPLAPLLAPTKKPAPTPKPKVSKTNKGKGDV